MNAVIVEEACIYSVEKANHCLDRIAVQAFVMNAGRLATKTFQMLNR